MKINNITNYFNSLKHKINPDREPGFSCAVIQNGELRFVLNHGLESLEHGCSLNSDSVYYLCSLSKQFTAACVLHLAEANKIKLNQDIRELVKETSHFRHRITIQNLLNHTSGIPDYFQYLSCQLARYPDNYFDNTHILNIIKKIYGLKFAPNVKHEYSNSNYIILAELVKKIAKVTLAKYAKKHIFSPLGMESALYDENRNMVVKQRVCSYCHVDDKSQKYHAYLKNSCTVGDGGVLSSLNDLVRWEINFHDNKVLSKSIVKGLTKNQKLANGEFVNYGNGLKLGEKAGYECNYHTGAFEGFRTCVFRVPEKKTSILYLSNNASLVFDHEGKFILDDIC